MPLKLALSLLEGEASPKTAEAATLLRRVAALAEAAPAQAALPPRPDEAAPEDTLLRSRSGVVEFAQTLLKSFLAK